MPVDPDVLFGKIAVDRGFVTANQLARCVSAQKAMDKPAAIGEILLQKDFVTSQQLSEILEAQRKGLDEIDRMARQKKKDYMFGKIAAREGIATEREVNECVREQAELEERGKFVALGELMLEGGFLTPRQVQEILSLQNKVIMGCPVTVIQRQPDVKCAKCGKELEVAGCDASIRVDDSIVAARQRQGDVCAISIDMPSKP
jgi:hypothetical protein